MMNSFFIERVIAFGRRLNEKRLRSEINALRSAKAARRHKILPILYVILTWYFVLGFPVFVFLMAGLALMESQGGIGSNLGTTVFGAAMLCNMVFALFAIPWFFRWYFIAVGLTLERTAMANRKEAELIAAIAAAEAANQVN